MAVAVVTAQNIRLEDAEPTLSAKWTSIGGGQAGAIETDFFFQGANCYSRKGGSSQRGIALDDAQGTPNTSDLSGAGTYNTVMFKYICTTPGLLDPLSTPGMRLGIGSSPSDYYYYDVQGNDTYPVDKSWLVEAIDPNVASHRTGTAGAAPTLTACDYYPLIYDQSGVSKSPNQGLDAIDIGSGLTITRGDGADPDAGWQDISDYDWGTVANRFGYVRESEGAFIIFGMMVIAESGTATEFVSSGDTIIFSDGLFAAGFSGITVDLGNASTTVISENTVQKSEGTAAGEDTRPVYIVTGTSGSLDVTGDLISNFASVTLTSACTFTRAIFVLCGQIDAGSGATLAGSSILGSTVAANTSALLWNVNLDPDGELDNMNFTKGANAHHAIEFGTGSPLTMTLTGQDFSGFNASTGQNDSAFHIKRTTGTVTINLIGVTSDISLVNSYRTDGAIVVIVVAPVAILVKVQDDVSLANIQYAAVTVTAATIGPLPFEDSVSITRLVQVATVVHTAHGFSTGQKVLIAGANQNEYNRIKTITFVDANSYTFIVSGSPTTPATGTIIATAIIIDGETDVNGEISDTRSYSADQDYTILSQQGTRLPIYAARPGAGAIDKDNGKTENVFLTKD